MEEWDITHAFVSWKRHWVGWRFMYDISVHISLLNHITTLTQKKSFEWFVSCKLQQVREQQSQWQLLLEVLAFRFVLLVVLKAYSMMIITGPNFMMIKARVVRLEIRGIRRRACRKEMKVVRGTHQVRVIPWVILQESEYPHFITDRYTHEHMLEISCTSWSNGIEFDLGVSMVLQRDHATSMGSTIWQAKHLAQRIFRVWFQSLWCLLHCMGMWFESDCTLQSKWVLG